MKTYSPLARWALTAALTVLASLSVQSQNNGPVNAVSLDGTNGYVSVPSGVWFSNNFTVEGWIFARSYNDWERLIDFSDGPNNYNVYLALSFGDNGFPTMGAFLGNNGTPIFSATNQLPTNQWVHLAATLSGTTGTIYINGVASGSSTLNVPPNVVRTNNYIGRSAYPADSYANAEFDEIRIWNVARTPSQIQADMHRSLAGTETGLIGYWRFDEGTGTTTADISGNGQTATLMGGASWTNSTAPITAGAGSGLDFNGTNCQLVTIPHQAALDAYPITVMTWVNLPTNQPLGGALVNKYASGSMNGWQVAQGDQLYAWYYRDESDFVGLAGAGAINDGLWHHVAYVVDASGGRIYVDGELQQSVAWTGTAGACTSAQPLEFGIYPGDSCLLGQIDEVSIWNAALSTNEIQAIMHRSLLGTESNLVAYYRFDEGAGTTTVDATGNGNNGTLQNGTTWVPSGAPVGAPQVATFAATPVAGAAATLKSTVNAEGQDTDAWFQWGSTTAYGNATTTNSIGIAFTNSTNSAFLTGLEAGIYHFQLVGTNSGGTNFGEDMTFTIVTAPMVATEAATGVYATTATLNATVNPDEAATACYFEYGPTTNYGFFTATNIVPAGNSPVVVSSVLTGLTPGISYYFEVVTVNSAGSNELGPVQFTTGNALVVTTNGDDGSSGTLRTIVANAVSSDTITFASNLSGATILLTNGQISLNNNLTIDASALPDGVSIDGNGTSRVFGTANDTTNVLTALTITNGDDQSGGGGGGLYIGNGGCLTLSNCIVAGNSTTTSGGAFMNYGNVTMIQSTLAGNEASINGSGGGVFNFGTLTVVQSTLASNSASSAGGAIYNNPGDTLTVIQSTLTGNSAVVIGGGIANVGTLLVSNSIVAGNIASDAADIDGDVTFGGNNLVQDVAGTVTGAYTSAPPNLAPLGSYGGPTPTMPPLTNSPAVDAGGDYATNTSATDQRGYPRLSGAHVDIGAVELQQATAATFAASNITGATVTLNGAVTPNELATAWYFQFGTTTNYGAYSATNSLPPGFDPVTVSNVPSSLAPGTTYHFQLLANDGVSIKTGGDSSFTTVPLVIVDNEIVVAITSPANKFSTTNSSIAVKGTIKGGGANPLLQVTVNGNTPVFATNGVTAHGSIAWSCAVPLSPGRNVIAAQTIDTNGTEVLAAPATVTVFYSTTLPSTKGKSTLTLAASPAHSGKISGETSGASLETNKVYTVTAAPLSRWVFTNWTAGTSSNSVLGSNESLSFIMTPDLVLQANFVSNQFTAVEGVYDGLFSPSTGASEETSGFVTATVAATGTGAYTGRLMLDGGSYSFSGAFDLSGDSETTVTRTGLAPVEVVLHLNLPAPDDQMTGYVVNFASNGWTSELLANRTVFGKSNSATNYAGKYTFIIPPGSGAPANSPGGYSSATLANTSAGVVTLGGSLADKTTISQSTAVSKDGNIPLYVSLYSKKGSLQGWLTLTNAGTNQTSPAQLVVGTNLAWFKTSVAKSLYSAGFTNTNLGVAGSRYTGNFTLTNGILTLSNGGVPPQIFTNVKVAGNKLLSSNSVVLGAITPGTGAVTLTLKATATTPKITGSGVILQDVSGTNAAGWFPGTNESGYFLLQQ